MVLAACTVDLIPLYPQHTHRRCVDTYKSRTGTRRVHIQQRKGERTHGDNDDGVTGSRKIRGESLYTSEAVSCKDNTEGGKGARIARQRPQKLRLDTVGHAVTTSTRE
jgi:hypothetical protein